VLSGRAAHRESKRTCAQILRPSSRQRRFERSPSHRALPGHRTSTAPDRRWRRAGDGDRPLPRHLQPHPATPSSRRSNTRQAYLDSDAASHGRPVGCQKSVLGR
jgi:hypothetical protein